MPLQYARDGRHRIRIILTDPLTVAELVGSVERQLADGAWLHGLLVDARAMCNAAPAIDIRLLLSCVSELVAANGLRGPIAFVAKESAAMGSAQMYTFMGGQRDSLEVFWNAQDAQEWLDERIPQPRKTLTSRQSRQAATRKRSFARPA